MFRPHPPPNSVPERLLRIVAQAPRPGDLATVDRPWPGWLIVAIDLESVALLSIITFAVAGVGWLVYCVV